METKDVVEKVLQERIEQMERYMSIAKALLKKRNYLQTAVRLEEAAQQGKFDNFMLSVFDSMTRSD